jgi:ATP-dependent protease HslVU (ClpYQ) peptidase subunit
LRKFEKNLKKQHKQVIKQYVNQYKEEMEEGELLRLKAAEHIREEEEK